MDCGRAAASVQSGARGRDVIPSSFNVNILKRLSGITRGLCAHARAGPPSRPEGRRCVIVRTRRLRLPNHASRPMPYSGKPSVSWLVPRIIATRRFCGSSCCRLRPWLMACHMVRRAVMVSARPASSRLPPFSSSVGHDRFVSSSFRSSGLWLGL